MPNPSCPPKQALPENAPSPAAPAQTATLFDVTPRAAERAKALLSKRGAAALRVSVMAGGCSGFSYDLQPHQGPPLEGDLLVQMNDLSVYVDRRSVLYLAGTTLDYQSTLFSNRFVFKNPNATSSCSCGESFGV